MANDIFYGGMYWIGISIVHLNSRIVWLDEITVVYHIV